MSFGVSVGDFIAVGTHALRLYWAYKDAPGEFKELCRELLTLHTVLDQLRYDINDPDSVVYKAGAKRQDHLARMLNNCDDTLDELDLVYAKYWKLGVGKRSFSWDRVKFGKEKLEDVRGKLAVHTSSINVYLQVVSHTSLSRIETTLLELMNKMNDVYDQGRVKIRPEALFSARMSSCGASTTGSIPCSEDLEEIIIVLEEEGVPKEDLQKNMTFISSYVEHRVEEESRLGSSSGHSSPWSGSMRSLTFEDVAPHERLPKKTNDAHPPVESIFHFGREHQGPLGVHTSTPQTPMSFPPSPTFSAVPELPCHGQGCHSKERARAGGAEIIPASTDHSLPGRWNPCIFRDSPRMLPHVPDDFLLSPPHTCHVGPQKEPELQLLPEPQTFIVSNSPSPQRQKLLNGLFTPPESPVFSPVVDSTSVGTQWQQSLALSTLSGSQMPSVVAPPIPIFYATHILEVPPSVKHATESRYLVDMKHYLQSWARYETQILEYAHNFTSFPECRTSFPTVEYSASYSEALVAWEGKVETLGRFAEASRCHLRVMEHWNYFLSCQEKDSGVLQKWREEWDLGMEDKGPTRTQKSQTRRGDSDSYQ